MATRYVHNGSGFVELGGAAAAPFPGPILADTVNTASSSVVVTTTVGSASPNNFSTPGSWQQIDASLSADAGGVMPILTTNTLVSTADSSTLLQIGVGASSSEVVWATFPIGYWGAGPTPIIPGLIPAGSRVAARVLSSAVSSQSIGIAWVFLPDTGLAAPVSYGTDATDAQGVSLTYPGTINTLTGWSQITASTSADIDALAIFIQGGADATMADGTVLVDLGVGAAASEVAVATFCFNTAATEFFRSRSPQTVGLHIPAGSRISCRYQTTSALQGTLDVAIVGAALA